MEPFHGRLEGLEAQPSNCGWRQVGAAAESRPHRTALSLSLHVALAACMGLLACTWCAQGARGVGPVVFCMQRPWAPKTATCGLCVQLKEGPAGGRAGGQAGGLTG